MINYIIIVFVAFAGFMLSSYLFHKKREKKEHFVCPLRGHCAEVIQSDFSRFMGVPVENLGMLYYACIAIGYGMFLAFPSVFSWLAVLLLVASAMAFFFSLYLTFIQLVSLRKLCTWCLLSAMFCTVIFFSALHSSLDIVEPLLVQYRSFIIAAHVLFMGMGLGAATLTDVLFFKFLKDLHVSEKEADVLSTVSEFIWFALGFILLTGLALTIPEAGTYFQTPKFLVKLLVVGVIIVNGSFLTLYIAPKLVKISFGQEHDHKAGEMVRARKLAFVLGPISIVSWYSAFVLGMTPASVPYTFLQILYTYFALVSVGIILGWLTECKISTKECKE